MKKYMIPIGMLAGALAGLLLGVLLHFAIPILACAGAAFGIVAGAALQLFWNLRLPDAYFARRKKKTEMDASLFGEKEVVLREEKTAGHMFHEKNVEEEEEEVEEADPALRAEQERKAMLRQEWAALREQRRQEQNAGMFQSEAERRAEPQRTPARRSEPANPAGRQPASGPAGSRRPQGGSSAAPAGAGQSPARQKHPVVVEEDED